MSNVRYPAAVFAVLCCDCQGMKSLVFMIILMWPQSLFLSKEIVNTIEIVGIFPSPSLRDGDGPDLVLFAWQLAVERV